MSKSLLIFSIFFFLFTTNSLAGSSELIISPNSDFSNASTKYSQGQTIYVKVKANSEGSGKRELNLRDNEYNLVSSYSLEYLGNNEFKGSLSAPKSEGFYSLEAKIESEGSISTSVKTVQIGNSNSSSVKVNIQNNVAGQTTTSSEPSSAPVVINPQNNGIKQNSNNEYNQDLLSNPDFILTTDNTSNTTNNNFISLIRNFFTNIINFF